MPDTEPARANARCQRCERTYPRTLLFWDGWEFTATCVCGGLIKRTKR